MSRAIIATATTLRPATISAPLYTRMARWRLRGRRQAFTPTEPATCSRPTHRTRTTGSMCYSCRPALRSRSTTAVSRPRRAPRWRSLLQTLLANDRDPNDDPLSIVDVVPGVGGIPTYNAQTGTVTFTPNTGFIGAATFTYRITDGTNDPASASVNLTVLPPSSTAAVVRLLGHAGDPFRSRSEQRQSRREVPRHRGGRDHGSQVLQGGGRHRHSRRVVVDQHRDPSR